MPSTCVFEFDRPDRIYYSGETIKLRIKLNTTSNKKVRRVYLQLKGEAKVDWEEPNARSQDDTTQYYTQRYRGAETYLNECTNLFVGKILPAGHHAYSIRLPVPLSCPTSCTEKYGHIRYEVAVIIDCVRRLDYQFIRPLTIIKPLNLNLFPEYALPLSAEEVQYFCWFCGSSGPVIATLSIPFGGYAPGQKISYKLVLDNKSKKYDLDKFELKFIQNFKFEAKNGTCQHSNTLAKTGRELFCLRLTKRTLEGQLNIPSVPPTSQNSAIISISYAIKMKIDCGCRNVSEVDIPIAIGTVPLLQSAEDKTPDSDKPPNSKFCKPPTFEESISFGAKFIDKDADEYHRLDDFVPKYPMYTNLADLIPLKKN